MYNKKQKRGVYNGRINIFIFYFIFYNMVHNHHLSRKNKRATKGNQKNFRLFNFNQKIKGEKMQLLLVLIFINLLITVFLHIDTITHIENKIDLLREEIKDNTINKN